MPEMKNSGIEWIGAIPAYWDVKPLKYNFIITSGSTPDSTVQDFWDGNIIWITPADFKTKDYYTAGGRRNISELGFKSCSTNMIPVNSIIFSKRAPIGSVVINTVNLCTNQGCLACIPKGEINTKFYYYIMSIYEDVFNLFGSGTTFKEISATVFGNMCFAEPPIREQQRIVSFLDQKCSEIDSLTEDIQSQIDILEEYKKSVITEAVTKGLNPDVEMKDSGIEWIGMIPDEWDVKKITYIIDQTHPYAFGDGDHGTIKAENYMDEGIPYIRVQNVTWCSELSMDNVVYISEEQNKKIQNSTLRPNDVLFVKTGATIGKTGIIPESVPIANTTSHVGKITVAREYNAKFVLYVLSSFVGYKQFWDIASQKATRPELSIDESKTIKVLMPKKRKIQDDIVQYLDRKCAEIDAAIIEKKTQLETLTEYKKSLIYEYVTGKKEVPADV